MITYNVKLNFEIQEDKEKYLKTLESQRFVFNEASKIQFKQKQNNIVVLHHKFYKKFRNKNLEIKADIVIAAENECLSKYKSIKSNKHKIENPIEKKKLSIQLNANTCTLKIHEHTISLNNNFGKRIKASFSPYSKLQTLINQYPVCDPLIFERNGDLWLSLTFKTPELVIKPERAVGIDLGVNRLAATSEGKIIKSKSFNARKRSLRHLKSQLKSKTSKGSKSAKAHLKKLKRKEYNVNNNFIHHLANELLKTDANIIVLEDLAKIKNNPKNKYKKNFNNKLSQVSFYKLHEILTYKAKLLGKEVLVINPEFTSQIDSRTGKRDGIRRGR